MEKVFQSKEPLRGLHILIGGYSTDGGLMHRDVISHFAKRQRLEVGEPMLEEISLVFDQTFGHLDQRPFPLFNTSDKP